MYFLKQHANFDVDMIDRLSLDNKKISMSFSKPRQDN